jgi:flavin-dependent dehydrogenase
MVASANEQFDCIVIGGGPAGSAAAAMVAAAGYSTLLVEREEMPRPHVGESLMPESYWVFERIGVLEKLKSSAFSKKVGVQFVSNSGRESAPFFFRDHDPRDSSETWHVDRAEFDKMLFDNAAEKGAVCRDNTRVADVLFDGGRATGVVLDGPAGRSTVAAKVVMDATGQQSLIANKLGLKEVNPLLRKAAIWRHYRGANREESGGGVKTIILHTNDKQAWFWYIPQVGDNDYLLKGRGRPAEVFDEEVAKCEGIQQRIEGATVCDDLRVAKEFSYMTKQAAGDGWVLIGDAWGFIDPVYSSGVYFALKSAELAADAVIDGLGRGDTSQAVIGAWADDFKEATTRVRKLVHAFYSGEFRVGKFIGEHPQHSGRLTDLLIGRIFDANVGEIFDDLEPWLQRQVEVMPA